VLNLAFQTAQSAPPPPPPIPALPATPGAVDVANAPAQAGTTVQPPNVYQVSPDIPPEVVPIIAIIFGSIAFMVVFSPIVRGIMKWIDRRQNNSLLHGPAVADQLQQLQQSVDAMAIEIERISESQRFTSKLMAEREKNVLPSGNGGA
jgi:hypothetical protein